MWWSSQCAIHLVIIKITVSLDPSKCLNKCLYFCTRSFNMQLKLNAALYIKMWCSHTIKIIKVPNFVQLLTSLYNDINMKWSHKLYWGFSWTHFTIIYCYEINTHTSCRKFFTISTHTAISFRQPDISLYILSPYPNLFYFTFFISKSSSLFQ